MCLLLAQRAHPKGHGNLPARTGAPCNAPASEKSHPTCRMHHLGGCYKLVQTDPSQIAAEDRVTASTIAGKIRALKGAEGVASIEQCAVAVRLAGTKQENVLPEIKVVGNGWISLMAYQAKGYGYIAP